MFFLRNSLDTLDSLSSTDLTCQWARLKEPTLTQYKPVPIEKFDCYKYCIQNNSLKMNFDDIR